MIADARALHDNGYRQTGEWDLTQICRDWWEGAHEVHGMELKGPFPHENGRFAVWMSLDVTANEGPMAGKRMQMQEVCLYTVEDGKISRVEFYWDPTGYGE